MPDKQESAPAAPKPDDAHLLPGDMAGMVLVQGDMSISSACTVTAIRSNQVYLCGHPFLSLGDVQFPMARTEVVTTLSSTRCVRHLQQTRCKLLKDRVGC